MPVSLEYWTDGRTASEASNESKKRRAAIIHTPFRDFLESSIYYISANLLESWAEHTSPST